MMSKRGVKVWYFPLLLWNLPTVRLYSSCQHVRLWEETLRTDDLPVIDSQGNSNNTEESFLQHRLEFVIGVEDGSAEDGSKEGLVMVERRRVKRRTWTYRLYLKRLTIYGMVAIQASNVISYWVQDVLTCESVRGGYSESVVKELLLMDFYRCIQN